MIIKTLDQYILETSSKKLEDVNSSIKKMMNGSTEYDLSCMFYFILCANVSFNKIEEISNRVHGFRDFITTDKSFTFDMDDAIEKYKQLLYLNNGVIQTQPNISFDTYENEYTKKALETIEKILKYYKKVKNVSSVKFCDFTNYCAKANRVLMKTDKDSDISKNNIVDTIFKHNIDIRGIIKTISKYKENNKDKDLIILTRIRVKPSDEFEDNDRLNDKDFSVLELLMWNDRTSNSQISVDLFVDKNDYRIGFGFVGSRNTVPIAIYSKNGGIISNDKKLLSIFKKQLDNTENAFGKKEFNKILEDIFEIYSNHGVKIKFDYTSLKEKIDIESR